jgi:hypothetical protein
MSNLPPQEMDNENRILTRIHEGMEVVDAEGHKVGKVDLVQLSSGDVAGRGAEIPSTMKESGDSIFNTMARGLQDEEYLPDEIKSRLMYSGFVRVDSNELLKADRYIVTEQIESVKDGEVHLKTRFRDLPHA